MLKHFILICTITVVVFMFSACAIFDPDLNMDLHGKVDFVADGDGNYLANNTYHLEYQGKIYDLDKKGLFDVERTDRPDQGKRREDGDVLLGWNGPVVGIGYIDRYYSDTAEDPIFIYLPRLRDVFFSRDYNWETDVFVSDEAGFQITFENAFVGDEYVNFYDLKPVVELSWHSEKYPRIRTDCSLIYNQGKWYICNSSSEGYELSQQFVEKLKNNGVISN